MTISTHVCALSGPEDASCLCTRNEGLSLDQVTCAGTNTPLKLCQFSVLQIIRYCQQFSERFLLLSTLEGLFGFALDNQLSIKKWDTLNVSAPQLVAHDPVNGELFWVEQQAGKGAAQIYRHVVTTGDNSLVMEVKFNQSRPGPQGKYIESLKYYSIISYFRE